MKRLATNLESVLVRLETWLDAARAWQYRQRRQLRADVVSTSLFVLAASLFLVSGIALVRGSLAVIQLHNRRDAGLLMGAALMLWVLSVLAVTWGDAGLPTIDLW